MKIPKFVDELLGYNDRHGRVKMIRQITEYNKYPNSIGGYLYRIDMQKYQYPRCFGDRIERFAKWCEREYADVQIHRGVEKGWNTYAVISITDPVALALEKVDFIAK